jgi:hypothetical protein
LANTPAQVEAIVEAIKPFTPPLLLDQFGNYVVQCCLRFENNQNQFIFDAIAAKIVEVGTARFGARATRTCLESQYTSKRQQKSVATAIVQHGAQLSLDTNGSILIGWLLDMSTLPGKYGALAPIYMEHLVTFCTHKLASNFVYKIIHQKTEEEARQQLLSAIFFNENPEILCQILLDIHHGMALIRKIYTCETLTKEEHIKISNKIVGAAEQSLELKSMVAFKKLLEDMNVSIVHPLVKQREAEIISPLISRVSHFQSSGSAFPTPSKSS